MIVSLHVTHRTVGADAITGVIPELNDSVGILIDSLKQVDGYVVLSTCNRFEFYASTTDDEGTRSAIMDFARSVIPYGEKDGLWYTLSDKSSIKHLFRVTCGLDSIVLGEDQIQGQVKDSFLRAKADGHISRPLNTLFEKALHVGKKVRSETELNNGAVSIGSAAVELAHEKLGSLEGKSIAIIGAGDMASVIAKSLINERPNTVFVSNRTYEHAMVLANQLGGTAVSFDRLQDVLGKCDLVIVATGAPHVLLDRETVEISVSGRESKLLIIDISVPRNVSDDVSEIENVELDTMGDIMTLSSRNLEKRCKEIADAERIIIDELNRMDADRKEIMADRVISEIAKKASDIRHDELEVALARAKNGADIESIFDDFSRALVSKIMAEPFEKLKEASRNGDAEFCEVATDLFGVDEK